MSFNDLPPISLEWIVQDGCSPEYGAAVRKRIRRQAMKRTAIARKQSGKWGQHNCLQMPSSRASSRNDKSRGDTADQLHNVVLDARSPGTPRAAAAAGYSAEVVNPCLSASAFANMTSLFSHSGIQVFNFCSLIHQIHVGRVAKEFFACQPTQLVKPLHHQRSSVDADFMRRMAKNPCLKDATECLSVKVYELLNPSSQVPRELILRVYGRALKSLHSAVYSPTAWSSAEVLCAAETLSLFEILNNSEAKDDHYAWALHVAGASRLIQLRGPARFSSHFEKQLLFSAASSIICECIRTDQACFLERQEWRNLWQEVSEPGPVFAFNSRLSLWLWDLYVQIPGLFRRVTHAVLHRESMTPTELSEIRHFGEDYTKQLRQWRAEFRSSDPAAASFSGEDDTDDVLSSRWAMLGAILALSIAGNRLFSAVYPLAIDILEPETSMLSQELETLTSRMSTTNPWVGLLLVQKMAVAGRAARETATLWTASDRKEDTLIEKWRFKTWCRAIPRHTSTRTCCDLESD